MLNFNHFDSWLRREDGTVSVEFALWIPVFFMIFLLVADTSAAFLVRANMWHLASDVSRAVVLGHMTIAEAEAMLAQTTYYTVQFSPEDSILVTRLAVPFSEIGTGLMLSIVGNMEVVLFNYLPPEIDLPAGV